MRRALFVIGIATVGCAGSTASPGAKSTTATYTFAPTCATIDTTRDGHAEDVDGDGTPDWIVSHYDSVDVYVRRGECLSLLTTIRPEGKVAFVSVISKSGPPGVRDLSIDTWLFHGDRARSQWAWTGHGYVSFGRSEEIPGPHR